MLSTNIKTDQKEQSYTTCCLQTLKQTRRSNLILHVVDKDLNKSEEAIIYYMLSTNIKTDQKEQSYTTCCLQTLKQTRRSNHILHVVYKH